ncbi:cysteine-rich venom protein Mr30-like [Lineus longissimus]|uniref:cysteine-rich venom protein Mr30-like n=1 Tax=Lineus longissimus TaxID=88925 RepID=UPI00315D9E88
MWKFHSLVACGFVLFGSFLTLIQAANCPKKYKVLDYGGKKHSRCLDPASNFKMGGVSSAIDQATIVNDHNKYRGIVNPAASNMQKMYWDDELAKIAFGWASQCQAGHEKSYYWRQVPDMYPVGQNVANGSLSVSWKAVIAAWQNEVNGFVFGDASLKLVKHAHYTQMIWHDSSRIGCAAAMCDGVNQFRIFVCNYAPAGNIYPGWTSPYTKSADGTSCGKCKSSCSNKLCDLKDFMCYNGGTLDLEKKTCSCSSYSTAFDNGPQCTLDCSKILPDARRKYYQCPRTMEKCMLMRTSALYCPDSCRVCPVDSAKSGGVSGTSGSSAGGSIANSGSGSQSAGGNTGGGGGMSGSGTNLWQNSQSKSAGSVIKHFGLNFYWKTAVSVFLIKGIL